MTDLDQKVRKYLAERAQMRQMDFDHIHGLNVGDKREVVLKATDLTAILDEYDRRGAALVEAEAEVARLLTAFDGLDLTAPPEGEG